MSTKESTYKAYVKVSEPGNRTGHAYTHIATNLNVNMGAPDNPLQPDQAIYGFNNNVIQNDVKAIVDIKNLTKSNASERLYDVKVAVYESKASLDDIFKDNRKHGVLIMKRNDNRGASFVMVVVAMAIVAVLAVTVLWIALMNLQMKVTDEKNTDIFYSAEGVLDQICTGLQGDISKAYSAGYTKVMENYSDSSINEAGRQSIFAQEYLKSLKGSLESDNTGMHYKTEKLKD